MTQKTIEMVLKFRDERNWKQFHNPKDLAISISLEAAELLEVFQWSGIDLNRDAKKEHIAEELADVVNYCILMADACGMDLDDIVQKKVKRNVFSTIFFSISAKSMRQIPSASCTSGE